MPISVRFLGYATFFFGLLSSLVACQAQATADSIKLGLLAPLSGPTAVSGAALERGMSLAIKELNASGGVLERPLELVVRNLPDSRTQADAVVLRQLLEEEAGITAVFGGTFNGVTRDYLDLVHEQQLPFINVWGTVTQVVKNDYEPNFVFCIAMTDVEASQFLAHYGVNIVGIKLPSILADTTAWGNSNTQELLKQLEQLGFSPVAVERFDQGERFMTDKLERLRAAGADSVFLVGGTLESTAVMRGRATLNWNVPVLSQWGTSNRTFLDQTGLQNTGQLYILQTFSFIGSRSPVSEQLLKMYHEQYPAADLEVDEPMAVAHGYDAVHLLARAMVQSQSTNGLAVKQALEQLDAPYNGAVKQYRQPFSATNHLALNENDYMMTIWQNGRLLPAPRPRLEN